MTSRATAKRFPVLAWLVFVALLLVPTVSVARASVLQAEPTGLEVTILVDGVADAPAAGDLTLSAGRLTLDAGRTTLPLTTEGTTFVVVESGTALLDTDQRLRGFSRAAEDAPRFGRTYTLPIGVRVTLEAGTRIQIVNEGTVPVVLFLLSLTSDA